MKDERGVIGFSPGLLLHGRKDENQLRKAWMTEGDSVDSAIVP